MPSENKYQTDFYTENRWSNITFYNFMYLNLIKKIRKKKINKNHNLNW